MTASLSLGLALGMGLAAAVVGLVGDMLNRSRMVAVFGSFLLAVGGAAGLYGAWAFEAARVGDSFVAGGGFSLGGGLVAVLAAAVVVAGDRSAAISAGQRLALIALSAVGAGVAIQGASLLVVALGLETAAVCGYALVASARTARSAEAALKYFLQGAVASGMLVLGLAALVGGFVSSASYLEMSGAAMRGGRPFLTGLLLVIAWLAFKSGAAPLHSWAPDAYASAPPSIAGLLAGPVKLGAVTALAVVVSASAAAGSSAATPLGSQGSVVFPVLGVLSIISVLVGSLGALRQRSYTRMLAYAGVAQVGYALVAISSGSAPVALLFIATYALATTGSFVAAEAVSVLRPSWDGSVDGLKGLGRTYPAFGVSVVIVLMSLAGIPPLLGFWGKLQAFQSAIALAMGLGRQGATGLSVFYWVVALSAIAGSVISLGYYGNVLREVYSRDGEGRDSEPLALSAPVVITVGVAIALLAAGLSPLVTPFSQLVRGFIL